MCSSFIPTLFTFVVVLHSSISAHSATMEPLLNKARPLLPKAPVLENVPPDASDPASNLSNSNAESQLRNNTPPRQEIKRWPKPPPKSDEEWISVRDLVDTLHMKEKKSLKQVVDDIRDALNLDVS